MASDFSIIRFISEGMSFITGAPLDTRVQLQDGRKRATVRTCWMLKQQVGFREMLEDGLGVILRIRE